MVPDERNREAPSRQGTEGAGEEANRKKIVKENMST